MNTYLYSEANPIMYFDINGLASSGVPQKVPGTTTSVRIDNPHVPGQQKHAHIKPKGQTEVVINKDGTGSHGSDPKKVKNKKVLDFLRKKGFNLSNPASILIPFFLERICAENPFDPACSLVEPEQCIPDA